MKLNGVPELIQGVINENVITEEMLEKERKMFERSTNLETAREMLINIDNRWSNFYKALENSQIVQYDENLQRLILFFQAFKWIKEESIKAIDEKDYSRLAALKLLTDDIGERINQIIAGFAALIDNMQ